MVSLSCLYLVRPKKEAMSDQPTQEISGSACDLPTVVDLDGTLTPTDTLVESLIKLVKQTSLNLTRLASPALLAICVGVFLVGRTLCLFSI
jgi:hypothetical protein